MDFTDEMLERYSRHVILHDVGAEGQEKICRAKVLIIGVGGLGSPVALYLAAAGVGTIGLVDSDIVDISNLQRQVIHSTSDVGRPKVLSAEEKIKKMNPYVNVVTFQEKVCSKNILSIIKDYDFIVDGTDNFAAKFLINDACVMTQKPFSHGGILQFDGQCMTYVPGEACYRCIFQKPPPQDQTATCSQLGVLGSIPGMLGTVQATEVLKYLVGCGELLTNRLFIFNALEMSFRTVKVKRNKQCAVCGDHPTIMELMDYE